MSTDQFTLAAVRMGLANPEFLLRLHYWQWEAAFIEHWGVRVEENGAGARRFMDMNGINPNATMTFVQAARVFHTNTLRFPGGHDQLRRYTEDFDRIPPELAQVPLDAVDWDRIERDFDRLNPDPANPQVIDMTPRVGVVRPIQTQGGGAVPSSRGPDDHPPGTDRPTS
jgi:hypothetical protein